MNAVAAHYLHFLGLGLLFACLSLELAMFKPSLNRRAARTLARVDVAYGLAALLMLVTGLLKMMEYGKGPGYYGHNFIFHIKLTVCVVIFLLAVFPSFKFMRTTEGDTITYPTWIGTLLRLEMALLVIVPLLGVLIAQGYGYTD